MPPIPAAVRELAQFYLGYDSESVPAGDKALLARAFARTDWTNAFITEFTAQVNRCQRTWNEIEQASDDISYRRIIVGDVNRTDSEFRSESRRQRVRAFLYESDQLALSLGVRNYRNPENAPWIHYGLPTP